MGWQPRVGVALWPTAKADRSNQSTTTLKDSMMAEKRFKVAILWRGNLAARRNATPANNRFNRIFEELAAVGIHAEPAVYDEDFANEVREQLLGADGVLVWVDPIHQGKTREALDPVLRDVASRGPWVSA